MGGWEKNDQRVDDDAGRSGAPIRLPPRPEKMENEIKHNEYGSEHEGEAGFAERSGEQRDAEPDGLRSPPALEKIRGQPEGQDDERHGQDGGRVVPDIGRDMQPVNAREVRRVGDRHHDHERHGKKQGRGFRVGRPLSVVQLSFTKHINHNRGQRLCGKKNGQRTQAQAFGIVDGKE